MSNAVDPAALTARAEQRDMDELRRWLTARIAFYLDIDAGSIDPDTDLASYGLDSVYALSVVSDMQDRLGQDVDETAVRRCGDVNGLARYMRSLTDGR
ncbi:acyl carrier protein [Streptomyces sp. NPDC048172]|uniref:acyl carrier protein n=1 Tax=Streptomyces sp. NPDC048172 TaxID=3365505 RepID=UPI00371A5006